MHNACFTTAIMSTKGSVTNWLVKLQTGDELAAQRLWQRYFQRLVQLARRKLPAASRRVADEEDVAQVAFHSFCRGARAGKYPRLSDRDDLWRLLVVLTANKAVDQIRHGLRKRRGEGKVLGESRLAKARDLRGAMEQMVGREPTPEFAVLVAEQIQQLYNKLRSQRLRDIAQLKLEGYTNEEIAQKIKCSVRDVERKLRAIRTEWQDSLSVGKRRGIT